MKKIVLFIRIVYGLAFTVFGLDMFLHFIPQPKMELSKGAMDFTMALMNSGYMMHLIGATMLVSGIMLLSGLFVPLALALLAPFLVNSIIFHLRLEPTGLPMSAAFCAVELFLAWSYRNAFRPMLRAKVQPS